ncbi:alpha-protein kinase 2 [Megalops cyprinoides]|uniref:alpha-protein kinase 2 n=1 Tax=Megalops cyprinoides TaxID=118141 RepID=UPI001863BF55|nr:alpha-protein kinase 2 [Megalops cyprinoides]
MARFLTVLEIWRFGPHHHPVTRACTEEQHNVTNTREETTADQVDPDVTNKPLSSEASTAQPWPESAGNEQNAITQLDNYSLHNDSRADTLCSTEENILSFMDTQRTEGCMTGSRDIVWRSEVHQINQKGEVAQSTASLSGHVIPSSLNDSCTSTQAVNLMQADATSSCYGSHELWLRAGHMPAGDDDGPIMDKQNKRSVVTSFDGNRRRNTKVLDYPLVTEAAIGLVIDDSRLRMPPVEGWPYTDSWSSAYSDGVHIVAHNPDEAPVVVVPELAAMAIKGQELESQKSEENSVTAENMRLTKDAQDHAGLAAEGGGEKVQTQIKILVGASDDQSSPDRDKEPRHTPLTENITPVTSENQRRMSVHHTVASANFYASDITDAMPSVSDRTADIISVRDNVFAGEKDMDIDCQIKVSQEEEKDRNSEYQDTSKEQQEPESETNALWEVTEDTLSSLDLGIKKGAERSNGSLTFSGYPGQPSAVEGTRWEELGDSIDRPSAVLQRVEETVYRDVACAPLHTSHQIQSYSEAEEKGSGVSHGTEHLLVSNQEEKNESPSFIMPLAPICQRSSHICADVTLERDQQCGRFLNTALNGIFDRTRELYLENRKEKLFHGGKGDKACSDYRPDNRDETLTACSGQSLNKKRVKSPLPEDSQHPLSLDNKRTKASSTVNNARNELSKLTILTGDNFVVNEEAHTAYITLDLDGISNIDTLLADENGNHNDCKSLEDVKSKNTCEAEQKKNIKMPHKASKTEGKKSAGLKTIEKPASRKEKSKQAAAQVSKKQETPPPESLDTCESSTAKAGADVSVTVIETIVITEKATSKSRGKKKKKHSQHAPGKAETETLKAEESCSQLKTLKEQTVAFDTTLVTQSRSKNDKPTSLASIKDCFQADNRQEPSTVNYLAAVSKGKDTLIEEKCTFADNTLSVPASTESTSVEAGLVTQPDENILKGCCLSKDKNGDQAPECKPKTEEYSSLMKNDEHAIPEETSHRKAYSEVVKRKTRIEKEVPRALQDITAEKLSDEPGSISLCCQFSAVSVDTTVEWMKEGVILAQAKRSTGDESPVTFTIPKASSKDLGRYQCCLSYPHGTVTSEFHLTSDVLNEFIPSQNHTVREIEGMGEDVKCAPLLFRDDFLSEQYFGENQPASIMTEEAHFGEGMHRRAFRTKLVEGMQSTFTPGHPCVLKVHNAVSHGTKNNEELVHKNYNLAVEECYVQNTAREYIKAYTMVAKSTEAFGEVPEIIPIFLVHRPSNNIPYATLEEELMGDFVKYSVKDGKEINLTRRDSEAGQKCCTFQHWVYHMTEGNLLVTDMQGVGMKLTDVGIATPKKGYKGFKGNCATSFIDQFKALHQCNKFCELLGLTSLQPAQQKPKRTGPAPKPKSQPQTKKKTFAFNLKSKS